MAGRYPSRAGPRTLDQLAAETEGFSGGDLKSLCQQAALEAMVRQHQSGDQSGQEPAVSVTASDFEAALATHDHEAPADGDRQGSTDRGRGARRS
jgi:SpoVK/Ycf46/Vps4 family AAA+-type ATPase